MNDTYCVAFWKHLNIRSNNKVYACCRYKTAIQEFDGDLNSQLYSDNYQKLRLDSTNGVHNPNCSKCYYEESLGIESIRQRYNKAITNTDVGIEYLEIAFDNICDLACDGCNSTFSSSWGIKSEPNLAKKLHIQSTTKITKVPNTIKKILFLGGEPLQTNRHRQFLKLIENPINVEITYNTNGNNKLSKLDIELFQKFKSVKFIVSIDGYGKLNETVRQNSVWDNIINFIDVLKQHNFEFMIHTTLHKNNYTGLPELSKFIANYNVPWRLNILTYPNNLDIVNLSIEEKSVFSKILKECDLHNLTDHWMDKNAILRHLNYINTWCAI